MKATPGTPLFFMKEAVKEAEKALRLGEVPIGCVIVSDGRIVSRGHNTRETKKTALGHAEIAAIEKACRKLGGWRLWNCELYVTLEPCAMCAGAILSARIPKVYFAAADPKAGAFGSVLDLNALPLNHKARIEQGLLEQESRMLLQSFFKTLRTK